ncbi:tetratricopeptide repeat protein [Anatilimnocola floriformis]|uniref:tetratricopeptide repeat protein n=1 Tax=Anatilimnocola floriformis TaxID=2948575 RepID=UPI0020C55BEE|nr:tetratricopeptide repeat protein [Anatilimnocola floriformis]
MRTLACCCGVLLSLVGGRLASAQPQPAPIRFGIDEVIAPVAEVPAAEKAILKQHTELDFSVGFAWRCAFVGSSYGSFANWHGRYVLFDGDNILEITRTDLERMLGKDQYARLHPPLRYRIPPGLIGLLILIVFLAKFDALFPTRILLAKRLLNDAQYVQAVEVYERSLPGPDEESTADLRKQAFAAAVEFLTTAKSLAKPEAEARLRKIISSREEEKSKYLRQQALAYEEAGDWNEALDHYEEAAELRELWDAKDFAFLQKCIRRVEQKQNSA